MGMEIKRYEFEIVEVGDPRTVGNPSLQEDPQLPSFFNRLGTSSAAVLRHVGAGVAMTGGSALLLTYAAYLTLQGGVNAIASLMTGEEYPTSYENLQIATDNFIAFLKENF